MTDVLILPFDGANGSTAIVDYSPAPQTVTAYGNAAISTAQSKFGGSSIAFDGSGDYLQASESTAFSFGTGDFTLEAWVYITSMGNYHGLIEARSTVGYVNYGCGLYNVGGALRLDFVNDGGGGTRLTGSSTSVALNTWTHVAFARSSGVMMCFVGGVKDASTATYAGAINAGTATPRIGMVGDPMYFYGYIDEFRITKGVARYTANFTPPTVAFPGIAPYSVTSAASEVSLLLHGNGTNGSTTIIDSSVYQKPVTAYGNAAISTAQSKFGGSSIYFDGTGDYLSIPSDSALNLGTGDFTVEGWFYYTGTANTTPVLVSSNSGWGSGCVTLHVDHYWAPDKLIVTAYDHSSSVPVVSTTTTITYNTWHHVALCRSGTGLRLFYDGSLEGTSTISGSLVFNFGQGNTNVAGIAAQGSNTYYQGYIDDLRITKGTARYTANFTPLSTAFPDATTVDPYISSVSLLLHGDGANGSTTIVDSRPSPRAITAYGNAAISTAQSKFGGSAVYFDGAGDYLSSTSGDYAFGTGDFTVELWLYLPSLPGAAYANVIDTRTSDATGFSLGIEADGKIFLFSINAFRVEAGTASAATWNHIALSRSSGVTKVFLNGTQVGSDWTASTNYTETTVLIGKYYGGSAFALNGYIDDLRITKGVARYTSNFTPPGELVAPVSPGSVDGVILGYGTALTVAGAASVTVKSSTSLVITGNGGAGSRNILDVGPYNHVLTVGGNVQFTSDQSKYADSSIYFDGGAGSYITLPIVDSLQFSGAFTIEMWIRPSDQFGMVIGNSDWNANGSGGMWAITNRADSWFPGFAFWYGDWGWHNHAMYAASNLTNNVWQHIAISRDGSNVWRFFVDGVLTSTTKWEFDGAFNDAVNLTNNNAPIAIGKGFTGYLSGIRILKDIALYTENFTVPGYFSGYGNPNETTYVGYKYSVHPGFAVAVATAWAGFKYGEHTTWSFSCNDPVSSSWAIEDSGSVLFPDGGIFLTYGASNNSTTAAFGNTSLYFPPSAVVTLPTGAGAIALYADFTFEFWINVPLGGTLPWGAGFPSLTCGVTASTWTHISASRKSNVLRYYKNGQKFYEALNTSAFTIPSFGANGTTQAFYLDSIGFSNRFAKYDSNDFTRATIPFYNVPSSVGARMQLEYSFTSGEAYGSRITPAEADGHWGKTVLLVQGRGPVGSKNIVDAKGRTLFNQADVVYSDANAHYGASNMYFNGSASAKLVVEPSRNLDLINGDFTIECWLYPLTMAMDARILDRWGNLLRSFHLTVSTTGTVLFEFQDEAAGTVTTITGPVAISVNTWSFISVCRFGNDYRVWVNGVGGSIVTTTKFPRRDTDRVSEGDYRTWDQPLVIGASAQDGFSPTNYFHGHMEDLRITNGFARYANVDTYNVPSIAFLPTGSGAEGDPYWSNVVLLCHFDERVGAITTREAKGHVVTFIGQTAIGYGQYGGGLAQGAYSGGLTVPFGSEFDLSTGDFTIEAWVSNIGVGELWGNVHGPSANGWQVTYSALANPDSTRHAGALQWTQWNGSGVQDIAISVLYPFYGENSRWHHVAVVRKGDDITVFVDGVGNTTTIVRRPAYSTSTVWLTGANNGSSSGGAFYRHDEIRITRVARYTQNFNVPTGKFPEVAFSFGAAVVTSYYSLIPGAVHAASTVPGAIITQTYSAIQPLIIGKPSVEGPTFEHDLSILASTPTGGEGVPEDVTIADTVNTLQAFLHAQSIYVNDIVIAQAVRNLTTGFGMADTASAMLASVGVSEDFSLHGVVSARQATATSDQFAMTSRASLIQSVVVAARISIADTADRLAHDSISEVLALTVRTPTSTQTSSVASSVEVSSDTAYARHLAASSGMKFQGTSANLGNLAGGITEAMTLHAAPSLSLTLFVEVDDTVNLASIPSQALLFSAIMQEHVRLGSFFSSPAYTTWAMNTRNAAVTQYAGYNFNSFAKMGERYLGANDQGLYWLDGDTDAGRTVKSRITTGIIQPNGNKLSGVQYAYLGMRGNGQFVVTVTDEAGGVYNYTLAAGSLETARVTFGRGFRTRYFTFSLESQGQDFDLDSVEFVTTEMSRKIQR